MVVQNSLFFLGLCLFTLVGFVFRALTNYSSENSSASPLKLLSQATVVILTMAMWSILIFFK